MRLPFSRALLRAAPFIVSGAAKQRSSRCPAALIITSPTSVSLTLMIQPFLSSRRPDDPGPSPGRAQDRPKRWGGWVTRARRAASNTNASFRTESQSFLTRAVPRVTAGARLENRPSQDAAVRQTLGERIAAVRRFDDGPNAFVQRRETSVQSSLRESSSRNSIGVRKSQTVHPNAHRPPGRLRRSLSAFRPLRRPRWTG